MIRKISSRGMTTSVILFLLVMMAKSWMPLFAEEVPQRRWFGRRGGIMSSADLPIKNLPQEGKFIFLRVRFDEAYTSYGGYEWGLDMGWNHDYPRA